MSTGNLIRVISLRVRASPQIAVDNVLEREKAARNEVICARLDLLALEREMEEKEQQIRELPGVEVMGARVAAIGVGGLRLGLRR